jgi:hypothetical protein
MYMQVSARSSIFALTMKRIGSRSLFDAKIDQGGPGRAYSEPFVGQG